MIDYIFMILPLLFLFLGLAIWQQEYVFGSIASIGLIVCGIYLAIFGAGSVDNFLTQAIGLINIALGAYILIRGGVEEVQKYW